MTAPINDSDRSHWVNRSPLFLRPYLQLSRLDRPVGYWLLALPGWIGLAFASLSHGIATSDLKWAALILIGAIAMRGAGCTYNDIVDQDLDAQVARTALRPLPAGSVTTRQAWIWLFIQVGIGFCVWLCLPLFAKLVALGSIPLVAAYPFMKRITWWPQIWLGLTFNWAFLVAVAIKTGGVNIPALVFYLGLIFWTVGYDTIYAMQDVEDDAMIGVKSTARRFGKFIKPAVFACYFMCTYLITSSSVAEVFWRDTPHENKLGLILTDEIIYSAPLIAPFFLILLWQVITLKKGDNRNALFRFKSNFAAGLVLIGLLLFTGHVLDNYRVEYERVRSAALTP